MKRLSMPELPEWPRGYVSRMRAKAVPFWAEARLRLAEFAFLDRLRNRFKEERPLLAITHIQPPALLVLMGGTTVSQYEEAGQTGRLTLALERHTKMFRTVILMTTDRVDYTEQLGVERVVHVKLKVPVPGTRTMPLLASVLLRFRLARRATSIVIMDHAAAPAGWLAGRLSRSSISFSLGAPWAPPTDSAANGKSKWLVRAALRRVKQVVMWPRAESVPGAINVEPLWLPHLVDADLFCPLATTDPSRPRTLGVFLNADREADARVIMGVAERLVRRNHKLVMRAFVIGNSADARAASLQAEAGQRGLIVEFQPLPPEEMAPDAIARMRMCIAFTDPVSSSYLLRAMSCGVPSIAAGPEPEVLDDAADSPHWTRFVLRATANEEQVTRSIETLFREPGVRLRMAREGRRFVVAYHSIDAVSMIESRLLRGPDDFSFEPAPDQQQYDAGAEAEALAAMLDAVGAGDVNDTEGIEAENTAA